MLLTFITLLLVWFVHYMKNYYSISLPSGKIIVYIAGIYPLGIIYFEQVFATRAGIRQANLLVQR